MPNGNVARFLAVVEAGMGFAFLGIVIGYLPTIYGAFSRRKIEISLLDARAGSPPSAAELLRRYGHCTSGGEHPLDRIFQAWGRWSAEVLESHLSYPVLSFFRSQHNNQSWLAALIPLPPFVYADRKPDNWEVAPWDEVIAAKREASSPRYRTEDHF